MEIWKTSVVSMLRHLSDRPKAIQSVHTCHFVVDLSTLSTLLWDVHDQAKYEILR